MREKECGHVYVLVRLRVCMSVFMTSHKTETAAITPGEVIWIDMATFHIHSQVHTVGDEFSIGPSDQIKQQQKTNKESKTKRVKTLIFTNFFEFFFIFIFTSSCPVRLFVRLRALLTL